MKNKLTEYHYEILNQSSFNESSLIEIMENHFVNGISDVYKLVNDYGYDFNKCSLKNLRDVAKNLIAEYYICHNNKQTKSHEKVIIS